MHLLIIGGSDAGISAALRAQELDPGAEVTMALADDYPNFSICGLPYYLSGETPDWRNLAHRTEFPGINVLRQHTAESIDVARKSVAISNTAGEKVIRYDRSGHRNRGDADTPEPSGRRAGRGLLASHDGRQFRCAPPSERTSA